MAEIGLHIFYDHHSFQYSHEKNFTIVKQDISDRITIIHNIVFCIFKYFFGFTCNGGLRSIHGLSCDLKILLFLIGLPLLPFRECVRILDLRVQMHPGELWVSKQRVHIVLEASKSAGAKGDVPKICGFVHPLHPC